MSKNILILGGNGFIAHHMARKLKNEGNFVRTVDIVEYEYGIPDYTNDYCIADLRDREQFRKIMKKWDIKWDEVYTFCCFMGGCLTIFTGENDATIMHDNLLLSINTAEMCREFEIPKVWISSSACMYSQVYQQKTTDVALREDMDYPLFPDSDYGLCKGVEERIFQAYARNHGLNIRIGRFHNVMGIEGQYSNNKAKAPAMLAYKVAICPDGGEIEVLGDGLQTRSFIGIQDACEGISRIMNSEISEPLNVGSAEMVTINHLAQELIDISGKNIKIKNVPTNAQGVRGRSSDNTKIKKLLNWEGVTPLRKNLEELYPWILEQVNKQKQAI